MFEAERKQLVDIVQQRFADQPRTLIAIAGPPAAGKSTLAELLTDDLNAIEQGCASLVPMDGFHLSNEQLDALGRRDRKGAPDTFDADGFVELIRRLAAQTGSDIRYPTFDRTIDAVVPDNGAVSADVKYVIVEGNYLLLKQAPWNALQDLFALKLFVRTDIKTLHNRLIARWRNHGFDEAGAEKKAMGNDIPNANFILENSVGYDLEFDVK